MLTRLDAQGLTDALAALALLAASSRLLRQGMRSPIQRRLIFVFGTLGIFYVFRAGAVLFRLDRFDRWAEDVACLLPLAGLLLVEGLLRRHAPAWLKATICAGGVAVAACLVFLSAHDVVSGWVLGAYVTLALLALVILLLRRHRASLSQQENSSIDGVMLAGATLMLLAVTDFLPSAPIGMSGAGAGALVWLERRDTTSRRGVRLAVTELLAAALLAALFALSFGAALGLRDLSDSVRLGVVSFTLVAALRMVLAAIEERQSLGEARLLRRALALAELSGFSRYLETLGDQPLLKGLVLAQGDMLGDYDAAKLVETMHRRVLWTRQASSTRPASVSSDGCDQVRDLMDRTDASHAALLSRSPPRVALLTLPELGPSSEVEEDLALFCRFATIAMERGA